MQTIQFGKSHELMRHFIRLYLVLLPPYIKPNLDHSSPASARGSGVVDLVYSQQLCQNSLPPLLTDSGLQLLNQNGENGKFIFKK